MGEMGISYAVLVNVAARGLMSAARKVVMAVRRLASDERGIKPAMRGAMLAMRGFSARLVHEEAGEGFVDVLVKMLIVVVVGAVLLTIMRQAIPQMFTDMMTKIRDLFEV